jgi:putative ABC transport system permease protein
MLRIVLREAWARKRRLAGTVFAVFLAVALLSGTFVLSDTLGRSIDGFFANTFGGVDVVVRSAQSTGNGPGAQRGPLPTSLRGDLGAVPGVVEAQPVIEGFAQIVGADGKAVTGNGPRTGGNWLGDSPMNGYRLAEGRAPVADDEVVIDRASATAGGLPPGTRTTVLAPAPQPVTVVGIATFGGSNAFLGASYVGFTFDAATRFLSTQGQVSRFVLRASSDSAVVAADIAKVVPGGVQVITGAAATEEASRIVDDGFLSIFRAVLSGLAALSLLVAVFSIYNTQNILAAQRTRESALLRALGASRRQVVYGAIGEAAIVGSVSGLLGVGGGVLLTLGVTQLFSTVGVALPESTLNVQPGGMAIAFAVGVVATVLAGLVPARRSSRVAPVAALRAVDVETSRPGRGRALLGFTLLALGVAGAVAGVAGLGLLVGAIASGLVVVAAIVLGPVVAGPVVSAFGTPLRRGSGDLAVRNAARDPHRVSGAATALLIGTLLVTLATVLAGSLGASMEETAAGSLRGDLVISPTSANGAAASLSPSAATVASGVSGVDRVAVLGAGMALVQGTGRRITALGATEGLLDLDFRSGSLAPSGDAVAVRSDLAEASGWRVGSSIPIAFPNGQVVDTRITGVFAARGLVEDIVLPQDTWAGRARQLGASNIVVGLTPGADPAVVSRALSDALKPFGGPPVRDRQAYIDVQTSAVAMALNMVYVMLALAVVIAVLGIANTMSLSVFERTRELGLLRAVGLTRRQTRSTVRIEAVLVAAFGSFGGVVLGTLAAAVVVLSADSAQLSVFSLPVVPVVVILVAGALSGVLAAMRPARRAARLDVLTAISAA